MHVLFSVFQQRRLCGGAWLPATQERRTEQAQRWCSRVGEPVPGGALRTPWACHCARHPYMQHHQIHKFTCCCSARVSTGFLTNRSLVGGNCTDFLIAKFLFKGLQVRSVKLLDTAVVTTASSCPAVPQRRTASSKTGRQLH